MCGEMAGSHSYIPLLLGLGIDELSMNPQAIPLVKRTIKSLVLAETRTFIDGVLNQTTARGVYEQLREVYGDLMTAQLNPDE